jgi:uncharacterized protein (UPF0264 family)
MSKLKFLRDKPGLLVSVRSAAEARAALAGGADIIDVKEPDRGSLGAANKETISEIVRAVDGRALVSAAMSELAELHESQNDASGRSLPEGVSLFKLGLARCGAIHDWQSRWQKVTTAVISQAPTEKPEPVAVVYADWRAAQGPPPSDVLNLAIQNDCPALLIDTWDKSGGELFDHWPTDSLEIFLAKVRLHNIAVVLAGSLTGKSISRAARLAPDLVAVRTAACEGGRQGTVSENKVRELKIAIKTAIKNITVH